MIIILLILLAVIAIIAMSVYAPTPAPSQLPPTKVDVPMPPVRPPQEPSCFIKGIAASLVNEPEAWAPIKTLYGPDPLLNVMHRSTEICLQMWPTSIYPSWRAIADDMRSYHRVKLYGTDHQLTPCEERLLDDTIIAHPLGQYKDEIERNRAEAARQASVKTHFEKLGCPDQP